MLSNTTKFVKYVKYLSNSMLFDRKHLTMKWSSRENILLNSNFSINLINTLKAHVIVQYFSFGYPKLPILDKNFSGFGCGKFQMCPKVVLEMVKKQNNCDICKNIRIQIVIPNFLNFVTYICITLLDKSDFPRHSFSKIYFQNIRFLTKI